MATKLAVHGPFTHRDGADINFLKKWGPRSVKLFNADWSSPMNLSDFYKELPETDFTFRNWPQSEEHDEMLRDPVGVGHRHADMWIKRVYEGMDGQPAWVSLPYFSTRRAIFHGINEPRVWTNKEAVVKYYVAFLDRLAAKELRGGALNLSVGWPANTGPDTAVDWAPYEEVRKAIVRGNHILVIHEYWDVAGPSQNWGWWAGRFQQLPWNVPILIGEAGLDRGVISGNPSDWAGSRGWQGHLKKPDYLAQLEQYDIAISADPRIHSAQIFTYDYGSNDWASFGVRDIRIELADYAVRVRDRVVKPSYFPLYPPNVKVPETSLPPKPPKDTVTEYRDAPSTHYVGREGRKIQYVIWHGTSGGTKCSAECARNYLVKNTAQVSAHLFVAGQTVWRMVDKSLAANTVGFSRLPNGSEGRRANQDSYNIEGFQIAGREMDPTTKETIFREIVKFFVEQGWGPDQAWRLLFHYEVDLNGKTCPGPGMYEQADVWRERLRKALATATLPAPDKLKVLAEKSQIIAFNPNAALFRKAASDGYVTPLGNEFTDSGYTAQLYVNPKTNVRAVVLAKTGDWANVSIIPL